MRISDWSSDVCSSDLAGDRGSIGPVAQPSKQRPVERLEHDRSQRRPQQRRGEGPHHIDQRQRDRAEEQEKPSLVDDKRRSEERRGGKEGVRTCRSRLEPSQYKNTKSINIA